MSDDPVYKNPKIRSIKDQIMKLNEQANNELNPNTRTEIFLKIDKLTKELSVLIKKE